VKPRRRAENRRFAPGFRISGSDLLILLLGCAGTFVAGIHAWWMGLSIAVVTAHFFLFCNVFRISRRPELIWAGTFILLSTCTILTGLPGWVATIAVSLLVAAVLIAREMKTPGYHGVGWGRINPDLRKWWEASLKSDPNRDTS
jgi:hypothetical protein